MDISAKKAKSLKNAEKRRERSKVAARSRRGKESEIFTDLCSCLPIAEQTKASLDKASIMRLTLCNLKIKRMLEDLKILNEICPKTNNDSMLTNTAMSGSFLLVCSKDGDVVFVSESVADQLGYPAHDVMGMSIFDFSHQYDHNDIRAVLKGSSGEKRSLLVRMKCTASSRSRNSNLRSANYKVVNCIGRLEGEYFVSICEPLLHPSDVDIPLNKQTFLSKHSPNMKFEYVDEAVTDLLGYTPQEMIGKSIFEFPHAEDGEAIAKNFKSLYDKDQTVTDCYRFLAKGGGWMWVMTQATLIHGGPNGKGPASVVCLHFIISGREETDQIMSLAQVGPRAKSAASPAPAAVVARTPFQSNNVNIPHKAHVMTPDEEDDFISQLLVGGVGGPLSGPKCSTSKIFAPKTEDMDSGFLDDALLITKEEPADLTHLAPIAGDECVPLEDVPLLEDLLASLDERGEEGEYTILDPDSEEIPTYLPIVVEKPMKPLALSVPEDAELMVSPQVSPTVRNKDDPFLCGRIQSSPVLEMTMAEDFDTVDARMRRQMGIPQSPSDLKLLEQANKLCPSPTPSDDASSVTVELPPAAKIPKLDAEQQQPGSKIYILVPVPQGQVSDSVAAGLMNISSLVKSQDNAKQQEKIRQFLANIGLNLGERERNILKTDPQPPPSRRLAQRDANGNSLLKRKLSLHELTRQDCEVNAPTSELLQGNELLRALDFGELQATAAAAPIPVFE